MRRGSCAYFGGARSWSATGLNRPTPFCLFCFGFCRFLCPLWYGFFLKRFYTKNVSCKGGGVALYVKSWIDFNKNDDMTVMQERIFESIFINNRLKHYLCILPYLYNVVGHTLSCKKLVLQTKFLCEFLSIKTFMLLIPKLRTKSDL